MPYLVNAPKFKYKHGSLPFQNNLSITIILFKSPHRRRKGGRVIVGRSFGRLDINSADPGCPQKDFISDGDLDQFIIKSIPLSSVSVGRMRQEINIFRKIEI